MPSQPAYFVKGECGEVVKILQNFLYDKTPINGNFKKFVYIDFERGPDKNMKNKKDVESVGTINGVPDLSGKSAGAIANIMADIVFFNTNCEAGVISYKSRHGEVQVIPALKIKENEYTFDEKDLKKMGIKVSEKLFL